MNDVNFYITKEIPLNDLVLLYQQEGWLEQEDTLERLNKIIQGSFLVVGVFHEQKLIGFGRVLSDGISDAYLQDIVVDKAWRGLHLGKQIVDTLVNACKEKGISWLLLISVPKSVNFYKKIGWQNMDEHIPMRFPLS